MYTKLNVDWALPITHERKIHRTSVQEVFYTRIFVFLTFVVISIPFVLRLEFPFLFILYFIFVLVFYPIFIKPWEIILSNKRLILRHQYWNIGRFSTLISFNLDTLDTQQIAPRFKLIPVTIGFSIITVFSIPLLEFYLTEIIPTPLIMKMFFLIFGFLTFIGTYEEMGLDLMKGLLNPFKSTALFSSLIALIPATALIIFGLPRRKQMLLSTIGGHQVSLSTGIHEELTNALFAVGRKQRIKESDREWYWELPLLENEEVKAEASIGLIERKSQIIGLLSLILFIESIDQFITIIITPNLNNFIIFFLKVIDLLFIWFAFVFAKKYRRLIATNYRLLYQEEMRQISGLWGKRIYQYRDFPYDLIKGFTYSNFSAIQFNSVLGLLILILGFSAIVGENDTSGFTFFILIFIIIYIVFNYKNFTSLSFSSIGGGTMELFYRLPVFVVNLSHRLENRETIYNRFFPNILNESEVASLCNSVRGVKNPIETLENVHEISINAFIDEDETEYGRWNKVGQFRFSKGSVYLGIIFSVVAMVLIYFTFVTAIRYLFLLFSIYLIVFLGLNLLIQRFRSLLILKNRLFFVDEILPKKVAQVFGRLPERSIQEQSLEFVLATQFRLTFGNKIQELAKYLLLIVISGFILNADESMLNYTEGVNHDLILLIFGLILVGSLIPATKSFFENLPKYSLIILTRFGSIRVPFMRNLDDFNEALNKGREMH